VTSYTIDTRTMARNNVIGPMGNWLIVSMDGFQPRHLGRVDPEEGASDTGIFVRTRGPEVAAAGPQGDLPQLEMGEEFVPFGSGEIAVFFAGPLGPAAGDERPVVGDHVFGVDR